MIVQPVSLARVVWPIPLASLALKDISQKRTETTKSGRRGREEGRGGGQTEVFVPILRCIDDGPNWLIYSFILLLLTSTFFCLAARLAALHLPAHLAHRVQQLVQMIAVHVSLVVRVSIPPLQDRSHANHVQPAPHVHRLQHCRNHARRAHIQL